MHNGSGDLSTVCVWEGVYAGDLSMEGGKEEKGNGHCSLDECALFLFFGFSYLLINRISICGKRSLRPFTAKGQGSEFVKFRKEIGTF